MRAVWCLVFISIGAVCGKPVENVVFFPKEEGVIITRASSGCVEKLNLEADIMKRFFAWELDDSEIVRKYMFCLGNNSGYIDDNGYIVKDKLVQAVGPHKAKVDAIVEECNKPKYTDIYETVLRTVMCFKENSGLELRVAS